jgi:hypothetical protein
MDIQHQIPLAATYAPATGGPVYTVPEGETYRITEIRYRNTGASSVLFTMGVNNFEPDNILVASVALAPAVGAAYRTYKESLWLGQGASIFVGGGSGVYVEIYGIIANVISGNFAKDGAFLALRAREDILLEITPEGALNVVDKTMLAAMSAVLVELKRIRMGVEIATGEEIEIPPEDSHDAQG